MRISAQSPLQRPPHISKMLRVLLRRVLTAKEIKAAARPEFASRPEVYYPTKVFQDFGFHRAKCGCGVHYWRRSPMQTTCGDSKCTGRYHFIGKQSRQHTYTYTEAWEGFKRSLTTAKVPCSAINRYPVVARWRTDVDYVAAGIYCFQPSCVTGELEPPANPLICPQFCVRFNDLDNIGLTGRHYSGFIMLGIQAFNYPNRYVFFKEECVEFNLRWLLEELRIAPERITLVEDVWAGGGNLGPCVEYFVDGLEVGNMVFIQYQTKGDGSREELPVKVVDVGIGLERVPWLLNGSATSYTAVFSGALHWLKSRLHLADASDLWSRFGPLSCRLNVDEAESLDNAWAQIATVLQMPVAEVKQKIAPVRDMYIVLDHTRTALMVIQDGSLPANVGGGGNVRNLLRRVFSILKQRQWWEKLGMSGLLELFELHKEDLKGIYGAFPPYPSFKGIVEMEYERWVNTDAEMGSKLQKLLKKSGGRLKLEDWIVAVTSWGIPVDAIANLAKQEPPGNLYYAIAELQERQISPAPALSYPNTQLPPTLSLYSDPQLTFSARITAVLPSSVGNGTAVVLDRSAFYPQSGGQACDTGVLTICGSQYEVVDVQKAGPAVVHTLSRPISPDIVWKTAEVQGSVDALRRTQLTQHHSATHVVFAACRRVLGPHVWQNGAKKSPEGAHIDITHFRSLSHSEAVEIENEANRLIHRCIPINKSTINKAEAELKYGFSLYQGGAVASSELRVIDIKGVDVEACCGTHCNSTAEIGHIRLTKSARISDGVVRLHYVAGERAIAQRNEEDKVLNGLVEAWNVPIQEVAQTAERFFSGFKKAESKVQKLETKLLELTLKCILTDTKSSVYYVLSDQPNPTLYFSHLPQHASALKAAGKGVVFIGSTFLFALLGQPDQLATAGLREFIKGKEGPAVVRTKAKVCSEVVALGEVDLAALQEYLQRQGVTEFR